MTEDEKTIARLRWRLSLREGAPRELRAQLQLGDIHDSEVVGAVVELVRGLRGELEAARELLVQAGMGHAGEAVPDMAGRAVESAEAAQAQLQRAKTALKMLEGA